jgi:hypothetical protein
MVGGHARTIGGVYVCDERTGRVLTTSFLVIIVASDPYMGNGNTIWTCIHEPYVFGSMFTCVQLAMFSIAGCRGAAASVGPLFKFSECTCGGKETSPTYLEMFKRHGLGIGALLAGPAF